MSLSRIQTINFLSLITNMRKSVLHRNYRSHIIGKSGGRFNRKLWINDKLLNRNNMKIWTSNNLGRDPLNKTVVRNSYNKNLHKKLLDFMRKNNFSTDKECGSSENPGRHKYAKELEDAINKQILAEFNACFAYLSMAAYFGRSDVALPGCQGFFMEMHAEEHEHALIFLNYQLMRGGKIQLLPIEMPKSQEWGSVKNAFEISLQMEKSVKEKIESVIVLSEKSKDYQVADFLTANYLKEQNESISKFARLLTRANKMSCDPNGEFLFDKQLFDNYVKSENAMYKLDLPDETDTKYK